MVADADGNAVLVTDAIVHAIVFPEPRERFCWYCWAQHGWRRCGVSLHDGRCRWRSYFRDVVDYGAPTRCCC